MTTFKIGDVVQLKSGGQKMTVKNCVFANVNVTYFDEISKEFKFQTFEDELLVKVEEG
ncbi:DUF2158 domain-containing protein [Pedobacter aquae]